LRYAGREHLRLLDQVHKHVLAIVRAAVEPLAADIEHMGTSDLAIAGRKFSGNSVRCKRNHLLYHGTLLHAFDITLIDRLLKSPPRQPAYRATRSHTDFVMNLGISSSDLRHALMIAFEANQPLANWPRDRTRELVASRYSRQSWNLQR
jgi:lipoate-protein ligase A